VIYGVRQSMPCPATLPQERDPVPIVMEAGWAQGLAWIGTENIAPSQM